jgi:NAD(P)H-flavin reductase
VKNPLKPERVVIKGIRKQTNDTTTYTMAFEDNGIQANYSFQPGQFNMVSLFGIGEAPVSLSSEPDRKDSFDHTVRAVGSVTKALARVQEGDIVGIRGPYGSSWPVEEARGKNILIVAGGIGLAPLRPFITYMQGNRSQFGKLEILYGAQTPQDLLFADEFEAWQSENSKVFLTADRVPKGVVWIHKVGVVTTLFDKVTISPERSIVLTCGPEVMMKFVVIELLRRGFSEDQIYISLERSMKCGVAMCGHCQMGPKYICHDGPVFAYKEIRGLFGVVV